MIEFLDGPAAGQVLMLKRAPLLLRVTQDAAGEWDGLDQFADSPRDNERVTVYVRQGRPGRLHILLARSAGGSGWFQTGQYKVHAEQPDDTTVRSTTRWREWATAHAPKG